MRNRPPKKDGPKLRTRVGIFGGGFLLALGGFGMAYRGVIGYENHYGQPIYSSGAIAIGIVIAGLAFFPRPSMITRLMHKKR